jgi:polysaccharide deacetylase 2 family uncharacterized protein YibQ
MNPPKLFIKRHHDSIVNLLKSKMDAITQKAAVAKEQVKNALGMNNYHGPGAGLGHDTTEDKIKAAVGMGPGTDKHTTSKF